ncbi:undecaprenyl-diphosphate phosphatase [soil metagenome]
MTDAPITIVQSILFGLVQGLTEFLPISSTAHLRILPEILGMTDPGAAFTAVIQLGTVLAVWIYFWSDLTSAIGGWFKSLRGSKDTPEARMGWAVFWGTIPIVVLGFLLKGPIKSDAVRSLYVIAGSLIFMGIIMMFAEKSGSKSRKSRAITIRDGIVIGIWQCLALIPGMSRSGSTISGGLFAGFDRQAAARVSFLLSVPSVTAAGLYELISERKNIMGPNLTPAIVATVVAFVVGYASIAWLIGFLQKKGIGVFVAYRIGLGILLIVLLQMGVLHAQSGAATAETSTPTTASNYVPPVAQINASAAHAKAWADAVRPNSGAVQTMTQPIEGGPD